MNKLEKFDNLIEKLTSCVDFYNHSNMFNNKVSMYLANGELINVRFPKGGLAHLLGINIDYLRFTNKFRGDMNSYECLLYFLDESYTFRKLLQEGMISLDELFSKNVDEKIEAFKENVRIKVDDMLTIVKYDSERTYKIEEVADISNYYIIRQKNGSYYVLGLVRDEQKKHILLPTTSRKYDNYCDFDKFMARIVCKQELTYPNNVIIDNSMQDYYNKFYVTVDNKIKMADISLKFAKKYDAISSVGSDLLYSMKKLQIERQTSSLNKDKLRLLIDSIKSGNVLNVDNYFDEDVNLNDEISELIALYNDLICSNDKGNGLAFGSYSALVEEHSSLKEQYLLLKEELLQVKDRLDIVSKQNMDLQEQNALYRQQVDIYEDASKRALALIKNKEK